LSSCGKDDPSEANGELFDLSLTLENFAAHSAHPISLLVKDRETKENIARKTISIDDGTEQVVSFGKILAPDKLYYLHYFADLNSDGVCQAPPTDHVWQLKTDRIVQDTMLVDQHRMSFNDVCESLNDPASIAETALVTIQGQLALDAGIGEIEDLEAGAALGDAVVFVEGMPDQEAITDANGNFSLQIQLPADSALDARSLKLVMWYTVPKPGKSASEWDVAGLRFGAKQDIKLLPIEDRIELQETVALWFTKGIKMRVEDALSAKFLDGCYLHLPKLGAQSLVATDKEQEMYRIDYLPPDIYEVVVQCTGYTEQTVSVPVQKAAGAGEWEEAPIVKMQL
jgi:hypothetical protein